MEPKKSRVVAGLLGIFLGGFGAHKFYLGYTKEGFLMLVVEVLLTAVSFPVGGWGGLAVPLVGMAEGVIYLTKSESDFFHTYDDGHRSWF